MIGVQGAIVAFLVAGLFEYNFGDTEVLLVRLADGATVRHAEPTARAPEAGA